MGDAATADNKALKDFSLLKINDIQSSIVRPAIVANAIKIKPRTILMVQNTVQFGGSTLEDPNMHIRNFIELCKTFEFTNASEDTVKLRLFPFSLTDKAKCWFHSLPTDSITTWEELAQKFLTKFFVIAKTAASRNASIQFSQRTGESLCKSWERYKEMLRKFPHHEMPDGMVINCFYNGLEAQFRSLLDAASGGALWAKSYEEAYDLIEKMATNNYQNPSQRPPHGKIAGIPEVDTATTISRMVDWRGARPDPKGVGYAFDAVVGGHPKSPVADEGSSIVHAPVNLSSQGCSSINI